MERIYSNGKILLGITLGKGDLKIRRIVGEEARKIRKHMIAEGSDNGRQKSNSGSQPSVG